MMEKVWPYRVRVELTVASGAEMSENAIEGCGEFYEDERLDGTWFLVSFKGQELPTVKKDKSPIISFNTEKNLMNANMGCNGIGGAYELMENTMYFNSNFMSTQMYCEGLMGLEKDFSKAIAGKTFKYSFLGKNVVFSTMDGVDVLILKHK
jgi:heat shock protein HslJ